MGAVNNSASDSISASHKELSALLTLNIQGMNPSLSSNSFWKVPYMDDLIKDCPEFIPFVTITETWTKQYITDAQMKISNYNLFHADRKIRIRGGAALYVHNSITVDDFWAYDNKFCEAGVALLKNVKTVIVVLYRPPKCSLLDFTNALEFVENKVNTLDDSYTFIITGDFNLPNVCWESLSIQSGYPIALSDSAHYLLRFMEKYLLNQCINIPTRENNILDLLLTNRHDLVLDVLAAKSLISDHNVIKIPLSYSFESAEVTKSNNEVSKHEDTFNSLDFSKADFDILSASFDACDWDSMFSDSPENFAFNFHSKVLSICLESVPKKPHLNPSPKKKNHGNNARKKRKLLARLFALKQHNPSSPNIPVLESKLLQFEEQKKNLLFQSKLRKELNAIKNIKKNPSHFYKYTKKFANSKSRIGPLKQPCGGITSEPKSMANILQNQFTSVFSDTNNPEKENPVFQSSSCSLDDILFNESSIDNAIDELDINSAAVDFPSILLKSCKHSLSYPIYCIWRESFNSGQIPHFYKSQVITPIFKKGSKMQPKNYRPISLTSNIIKIFERVIRAQLVEYLEHNNLISNNQHGFRKGHSCLSELLAHYHDIVSGLANANADSDLIYLDFAKAFDKVDHDLLLKKFKLYGINGKLHGWISEFLRDRTQTVIVDGIKSYQSSVDSGVPQGTVLGPILFLLFVNDIELSLAQSKIRCFADDSRLLKFIKSSDDALLLQKDLDNVVCWAKKNNMTLNEDKFELIQHHSSLRNYSLLVNLPFVYYENCYFTAQTTIEPSQSITDLGVIIGSDLSFKLHMSDAVKRARDKLSWGLSVFRSRSEEVICTFYKSLVRPIVEYCCALWSPMKIGDIAFIEGIQRTASSKIASIRHLNYWERLKKLGLMSLQRRRERYVLVYMFKILHNYAPNDVNICFYDNPRLGIKAAVPPLPIYRSQITLFDSSFAVRGPSLWNLLPRSINTVESFLVFKEKLDKFILGFPDMPPVNGYTTSNSNSLSCWV